MPASVHSQDQDQSMMDTAPQELEQQQDYEQEEFELEEKRIVVLPGATETAASFQFEGEGHTLGNALRYAIMKNPEVEFCGYTIPHPSETKMNLRIQTYDSTTAVEALEKGLEALMDLCDVVTDKFTSARDAFNAAQADKMTS
ncbi:DNA-directed RNA polymerase core subunit RPC19 [Aspergillus fischeri NRRL 181]|uniref:DNA-directed RNA polymerase I and III 14 kDa polypeptide n=1 Tax=Neosartorya fischeri (strain ATCC 1020 / DSM 3700 / CBS 544.65 / FGSC A1164 / JCM 1740 / NRRL 181 / WB 181) TaxID=331117 RepID=A1DLU8_NEOFI|nr:DNA-directed RNA polymerase I and III 14 KDA polypeptide [Aspergillus fischeri NRRL 181]EAW15769.1 DNA-directed RNA polymerase I and III 14 KDA polypeptide [Aspergillus fischeri NRRL 181]